MKYTLLLYFIDRAQLRVTPLLFQRQGRPDHDDLVHRGRGQRQCLRLLHPHPHQMARQCLQTHLQGSLGSAQSEQTLVDN